MHNKVVFALAVTIPNLVESFCKNQTLGYPRRDIILTLEYFIPVQADLYTNVISVSRHSREQRVGHPVTQFTKIY